MAGILIILCGLVLGIKEGMIMSKGGDSNAILFDGVRYHKWFKYYHLVDVTGMILLISIGYVLSPFEPTIRNFLSVAGALILAWELKEVGYAFARWNTFTAKREHIVILDAWDIYISDKSTLAFHVVRIVSGLILIAGGLL